MRAARNWGLITYGETFEALATALVGFEDQHAKLFGRRGRDGGQDIRSSNGTCVYQAKHHVQPSAAKAIADAKLEVGRITEHRKPDAPRYEQWATATDWKLVTNATFNANDDARWTAEVVPLFQNLGLNATYWGQAKLDLLLDKHPVVDRSFFQNETRAFLSVSERYGQMVREEPFLRRDALGKFVGRDAEKDAVRNFLKSDAFFLVLHGSGGVGKTRLLLEACSDIAGEGEWQILWALQESMLGSGSWFAAIVPERPTILVVDDPEGDQLLLTLKEQLSSRMSSWKIVVTTTSANDPVLRFIQQPRTKHLCSTVEVSSPSAAEAETICRGLLDDSPIKRPPEVRDDIARKLSERLDRHPVWLTLAVSILDNDGDLSKLPVTAGALADEYLDEVVKSQTEYPTEQVQLAMRWIAILGTINQHDPATLDLLAEKTTLPDGDSVRALLRRLVERRALVQRGARDRLVEVKPDVLRDRVLTKWLSIEVGRDATQPSADATRLTKWIFEIMANGSTSPLTRRVLVALARTELLHTFSGRPLHLLDGLFASLVEAIPSMSASKRAALLKALPDVAYLHPTGIVDISGRLRSSVVETEIVEGTFRKWQVTNDDVSLDLAWTVYHAALGARTHDDRVLTFNELFELTQMEAEIAARSGAHRLPNDGQRAAALLERTLDGGPELHGDFREAAVRLATRLMEKLKRAAPSAGLSAGLRVLVRPLTALQRHEERRRGNTLEIQQSLISPMGHDWGIREQIVHRMKALLDDVATPLDTRRLLWELLQRSHAEVAQWHGSYSQHPEASKVLRDSLMDDLVWAKRVLEANRSAPEELSAARRLWSWHAGHDPDPEIKGAAMEVDRIYARNDLAIEFDPLVRFDPIDKLEGQLARAQAKASALVEAGTAEAIEEFIDRGVRFLGGEAQLSRLFQVAWALGERATTNVCVRDFVERQLAGPPTSRLDFALRTAEGWISMTRQGSPTAESSYLLTKRLVEAAPDDGQKIRLLRAFYADGVPGRLKHLPSSEECDWLRGFSETFLSNRRGPAFVSAIGWTLRHDWAAFKRLMETVLNRIPSEQLEPATEALIDRVYWAVDQAIDEGAKDRLPTDLVPWLLERLIVLPEFESTGPDGNWKLNQTVEHLGHLSMSWLASALRTRRQMEAHAQYKDVHSWAPPSAFARFVEPISEINRDAVDVKKAVSDMINLVPDPAMTSYFMPKVLGAIDPNGLVVPAEVARRLNFSMDDDEAHAVAKLAGAYALGTPPWRIMAAPAIRRAVESGLTRVQRSIFGALTGDTSRFWMSAPGEVPATFISSVEDARQRLNEEVDPEFRPFWEWHLKRAEEELSYHEQEAKEERGE